MQIVDLTSFLPWAWLLHFGRAFCSFNISQALLKNKYNAFATFIGLMIPSLIYSYFTIANEVVNDYEILALAFNLLLQFAIFSLLCKGSVFSKFFTVFSGYLTAMFATVFHCGIGWLLFDYSLDIFASNNIPLMDLLMIVLYQIAFSFIVNYIIKRIKAKKDKAFNYSPKYSVLLLIPLTQALSSMAFYEPIRAFYPSDQYKNFFSVNPRYEFTWLGIALLCVLLDIFVVFFVDRIEKIEDENLEAQKNLVKNKLEYEQIEILKKEKEEFRKVKHDLANIILTAKSFIEINKPEKAIDILDKTNDSITGLSGFSLCANETINTILFIKHKQAKSRGINLITEIDESYPLKSDDFDICRMLSNIIDNSLNAAALFETDDDRYSKISIEINDSQFTVKSENKYKNSVKKKSGNHGYGIAIIKSIAEKYNGSFSSGQINGIWYTETVISNTTYNNITPPPAKLSRFARFSEKAGKRMPNEEKTASCKGAGFFQECF